MTLTRRTYFVFGRTGPTTSSDPMDGAASIFERRIPARLVEEVGEALSRREVRKEDAAREAARLGDPDDVPTGYQRAYFGQDVLVVLTARGQATRGRRGVHGLQTLTESPEGSDTSN